MLAANLDLDLDLDLSLHTFRSELALIIKRFVTELGHKTSTSAKLKKSKIKIKIKIEIKIYFCLKNL